MLWYYQEGKSYEKRYSHKRKAAGAPQVLV